MNHKTLAVKKMHFSNCFSFSVHCLQCLPLSYNVYPAYDKHCSRVSYSFRTTQTKQFFSDILFRKFHF